VINMDDISQRCEYMVKAVHECKKGESCHDENHLCRIILRKDLERIREAVKDSLYFCKNCGRAAHEESNLCNPSKI